MMSSLLENVSRETLNDLEVYEGLLVKWNAKINIVGKSSIKDAMRRHFLDSLQLLRYVANEDVRWYDLGSGGGFPGLACAIVARETHPSLSFSLVESDNRKVAFLNAVVRAVGVEVDVLASRIEDLPPDQAGYVSARALAPLSGLLDLASPLRGSGTRHLFLKGEKLNEELVEARRRWAFEAEVHKSKTDPGGSVLVLTGVTRV